MTDLRLHIVNDPEVIMWKTHMRAGKKVSAIKAFRSQSGAGLRESKDIVEEYALRLASGDVTLGSGSKGITTSSVRLPNDGGVLVITTQNNRSRIEFTQTYASEVPAYNLPQVIADAALKYAR